MFLSIWQIQPLLLYLILTIVVQLNHKSCATERTISIVLYKRLLIPLMTLLLGCRRLSCRSPRTHIARWPKQRTLWRRRRQPTRPWTCARTPWGKRRIQQGEWTLMIPTWLQVIDLSFLIPFYLYLSGLTNQKSGRNICSRCKARENKFEFQLVWNTLLIGEEYTRRFFDQTWSAQFSLSLWFNCL